MEESNEPNYYMNQQPNTHNDFLFINPLVSKCETAFFFEINLTATLIVIDLNMNQKQPLQPPGPTQGS